MTYINIIFPTLSDVRYWQRVDQVLDWLDLPQEERPDFISLYFEEPDTTGHSEGPYSDTVRDNNASLYQALQSNYRHKNIVHTIHTFQVIWPIYRH